MTSVDHSLSVEARRNIEAKGRSVANDLNIDVGAYEVVSNLHWAFTLLKTHVERGPLAEANLSWAAFVALWSIWVNGEMDGSRIAVEIGTRKSSFSEMAKRLEDRGLLSRRPHPEDGRSVLFDVTPQAQELLAELWPKLNGEASAITKGLDADAKRSFAALLRGMADELTELAE